jgi:Mn-dependent DtxR family transcriptional regulator
VALLSTELFEILHFVYTLNARGRRPAMREVFSALSITPKTAEKRMSILESREMLKMEKQGRYRVAGITERGKQVILTGS